MAPSRARLPGDRQVKPRVPIKTSRMIWIDTHLANEGSCALYGAIGYREVGVELAKEL